MIDKPSTFQSIFFQGDSAVAIRVPDYQRAYSWEKKQTDLFLGDLEKYHGTGRGYYFGHFIAEENGSQWEIVDGQQRLTTFLLFLMVCSALSPQGTHQTAWSMIGRFSTVSYDAEALEAIRCNIGSFLEASGPFEERHPPSDDQIREGMSLRGKFTRSQRRMVLALLRFHRAFVEGKLKREKIADYIAVVMNAHCSLHLTRDKSVAVNIFEMHNTRGIPLSTLEIVKAVLMKFVFDHGGAERENIVKGIQEEFGEIYGMEEQLAARSFRGEMTMEQLLRLHLRAVDDGRKRSEEEFHVPAVNANADALVAYVDGMLHFVDGHKSAPKERADGVAYAVNFAKEFKKSVRILCDTLPAWDEVDSMVGDVLILNSDLSCQFFLVACRVLESAPDHADGRMDNHSLLLWERLLFTRDFHAAYYNLRAGRDNFPALFAACARDGERIPELLRGYLEDGFRPDRTRGLQSLVRAYLGEHKEEITNGAFHWWKHKIIYAIYKYETSRDAKIRDVMKGTVSVEHILPQEWEWMRDDDEDLKAMSEDEWNAFRETINHCINGIGNLLLITPSENTSQGNRHPAHKAYERYAAGGSYKVHGENRERWRSPKAWPELIRQRGGEIFQFILDTLVGVPGKP